MKVVGYVRVSDQKLKSNGERRQDVERQKQKILMLKVVGLFIWEDILKLVSAKNASKKG